MPYHNNIIIDKNKLALWATFHPEWVSRDRSCKAGKSVISVDRVPNCFLEWVANSQDKQVLLASLRHGNLTLAALEKLNQSKFPEVVAGAKLHVNWREEREYTLDEVLFQAVAIADIEPDRYKYDYYSSHRGEKTLLKQLLALDIVPDWFMPILHSDTKFKLARDKNTSAGIIEKLCKQPDLENKSDRDDFYKLIVQHPNTPSHILKELVNCESEEVKLLVVSHPNLDIASIREHYRQRQTSNKLEIEPEEFRELATSENLEIRLQVACHSFTPTSILERLVRDESEDVRTYVAKNLNSTEDILAILAVDKSPRVRNAVICNPNISLDILAKAIKGDTTNLNNEASDSIIRQLFTEFYCTEELFSLLTTIDRLEIQTALARLNNLPAQILEQLVTSQYWQVKEIVAQNKNNNISIAGLKILIQDESDHIRNLAIESLIEIQDPTAADFAFQWDLVNNSDTDRLTLDSLLERYAIAQNSNTPRQIVERLTRDGNSIVRETAIANLENNNLEEYISDDINIKTLLAKLFRQEDLSPEEFLIAAQRSSYKVLVGLTNHPHIPKSILEKLVSHNNPKISQAASLHVNYRDNLTEDWQEIVEEKIINLIRSTDFDPNTPEHILEKFSDTIKNCGMYALEEIAQQPNMPLSLLEELSKSQYALVQRGVAKNPKTPVTILQNIMSDGYSGAWEGIAVNPNTTVEMLEELINYSCQQGITNDSVPVSVAKNPNTPVHLLEKLVAMTEDKKNKWNQANQIPIIQGRQIAVELAIALVENPNLSIQFLEYFAQENKGKQIRGSIAKNSRTPIDILEKLSKDSNLFWYLLRNPNLPESIAERIASHKNNKPQKSSIDGNSYITQNTLRDLAFNPSSDVRKQVAQHPNTSVDVLEELIGNINNIVRQAVINNPNTPASLIESVKQTYYNANYSTSATELATLSDTNWHYIHVAVASNPHTSVTTLEQITNNKIIYLT